MVHSILLIIIVVSRVTRASDTGTGSYTVLSLLEHSVSDIELQNLQSLHMREGKSLVPWRRHLWRASASLSSQGTAEVLCRA